MPYCPKCGVEVEPQIKQCPLCSFPIPDLGDPDSAEVPRDSVLLNRYSLNKSERRRRWIEAKPLIFLTVLLTLVFLSVVFGFLDIYFSGKFTWSRYAISVNLSAALVLFFLMGVIRSFTLNLIGTSLTITAFLFLIDSFDDNITWFWNLGLIICSNIILWTLVLRLVIIHSRRKGLNIASYGIFAVTITCFSIDLVNNIAVNKVIMLTWAVPVVSILVPAGILFLLLHFLLSPAVKEKLRKNFHI